MIKEYSIILKVVSWYLFYLPQGKVVRLRTFFSVIYDGIGSYRMINEYLQLHLHFSTRYYHCLQYKVYLSKKCLGYALLTSRIRVHDIVVAAKYIEGKKAADDVDGICG